MVVIVLRFCLITNACFIKVDVGLTKAVIKYSTNLLVSRPQAD